MTSLACGSHYALSSSQVSDSGHGILEVSLGNVVAVSPLHGKQWV